MSTIAPPSAPVHSSTFKNSMPVALSAVLVALFVVYITYSLVTSTGTGGAAMREQAAFEDATGIHLVRVVLIAGGGIVGIHYQVLDPDKALVVYDDDNPPTVTDLSTGATIQVENHQHTVNPEVGRGYRLHFPNTGNAVRRGDTVTVQIGDVRLSRIVVQ